jgi:EXPERA (EXPanded EBP superfamily)
MRDMPPWFKCLVWMEVALQLPFFFVGAYAFLLRRNWIRTPALLYGINVTSTMVRCCGMLSPLMASASRMSSLRSCNSTRRFNFMLSSMVANTAGSLDSGLSSFHR